MAMDMKNIWFSDHAFVRSRERLSLIKEELQRIIADGLTVNIGSESKTNKDHLLFYSVHDDMCFVAVYDRVESVVITILPIDYHESIAWAVSMDAQKEARAKFIREDATAPAVPGVPVAAPTVREQNEAPKPTVFKMTAFMWDQAKKSINLGSYPASEFSYDLKAFAVSPLFNQLIVERLAMKGYAACHEATITIKYGKIMTIQTHWVRDSK